MYFSLLIDFIHKVINGVSSTVPRPENSVSSVNQSLPKYVRLSLFEHFPNTAKIVQTNVSNNLVYFEVILKLYFFRIVRNFNDSEYCILHLKSLNKPSLNLEYF